MHGTSWRSSGRISLWRYTENERNYPGWHLNADRIGCECLLALLEALPVEEAPFRTVTLTPPVDAQLRVPNNRRAAWLAPTRLRVRIASDAAEWTFPPDLEPAVLTIGSQWLEPLRRGIDDITNRRGDYSIGGGRGSLPLWFWWSTGAT